MKEYMVMAVTLYMAVYHLNAGKTQTFLINAISVPFMLSQARGKKRVKQNCMLFFKMFAQLSSLTSQAI